MRRYDAAKLVVEVAQLVVDNVKHEDLDVLREA